MNGIAIAIAAAALAACLVQWRLAKRARKNSEYECAEARIMATDAIERAQALETEIGKLKERYDKKIEGITKRITGVEARAGLLSKGKADTEQGRHLAGRR